MNRLLWENILQQFLDSYLIAQSPILGWAPIRNTIDFLVDHYVAEPLFSILVTWGVFTSIDWKTKEVYDSYEKAALTLIHTQGDIWDDKDRKAFKDAARELIRFSFVKRVQSNQNL